MSKIKLFNIRSLVFVSFPEGFVESFLLGVMVDLPTLLFDLFNLCFFFFFFDDDAFLFCFWLSWSGLSSSFWSLSTSLSSSSSSSLIKSSAWTITSSKARREVARLLLILSKATSSFNVSFPTVMTTSSNANVTGLLVKCVHGTLARRVPTVPALTENGVSKASNAVVFILRFFKVTSPLRKPKLRFSRLIPST